MNTLEILPNIGKSKRRKA